MELKQLKYFIAVAEELHFGRAARRLFISQPALSFDIRRFEERLGVKLLERSNKAVSLTNAGHVLLGEALRLVQQADEATALVRQSAHGLGGRLRIGFVNSMLYRGLPEAVQRFEAAHPLVEVILKEMNTAEQARALQQMHIDVGLAHWGHFPAEVEAHPWKTEALLCCLPVHHRLAQAERIDLRELAHEPFILFPRSVSPHYHDQIIATCMDAGFSPRIRHETRLWQTVVTMVEFDMGISLVPQALASMLVDNAVFRPLSHNPFPSQILWLTRSDSDSDAARSFVELLTNG